MCIYIFISDVVINIIIWYLQINSYALLSRINLEEVKTINSNNNNINNNNLTKMLISSIKTRNHLVPLYNTNKSLYGYNQTVI